MIIFYLFEGYDPVVLNSRKQNRYIDIMGLWLLCALIVLIFTESYTRRVPPV